jgi:hypothetical protein
MGIKIIPYLLSHNKYIFKLSFSHLISTFFISYNYIFATLIRAFYGKMPNSAYDVPTLLIATT